MGEVVQLRDYQRKDEPNSMADYYRECRLTGAPASADKPHVMGDPGGDVFYCSPPIKDTAPCEYSAQDDGDCA